MSAASNYLETAVLDFWLKNNSGSYTAPSTVYVALFTSGDSTGATGENLEAGILTNEVSTSGTGYVRKAVTFGSISDGVVSNSGNVTFDTALTDWGLISHVAVMDADSTSDSAGAGNVLFYGALTTAREILTDDTFQITATNLQITLA
jgi:hypothetical protein